MKGKGRVRKRKRDRFYNRKSRHRNVRNTDECVSVYNKTKGVKDLFEIEEIDES